jgi:1-aminocyclopropane-1-carboxylate deaminase/D-cysteine desulfhydrase-like pyridoxal-dependent ACC family enzyme
MSDQENKQQIESLLHQPGSPDTKILEEALRLARALENGEDRDWYVSEVAKAFAATGYFDAAIEIARTVSLAIEKKDALVAISTSLLAVAQNRRAMATLAEAELTAEAIEDESYSKWQKAEALDQIAKIYQTANEREHAKSVWLKAIEVAQRGQSSNDVQEIFDCSGVLSEIAKNLATAGFLELAKDVAQSIRVDYKRQGALNKISEQ